MRLIRYEQYYIVRSKNARSAIREKFGTRLTDQKSFILKNVKGKVSRLLRYQQ